MVGVIYALKTKQIEVDAGIADVGMLRISVDEEGITRIRERYSVSSPLIGRVRRITLDAGDPVHAQITPIAVIEPTNPELLDARALAETEGRVRAAQAGVRQAGAALASARAATDFAENDLTRVTNAFNQGVANRHELDSAQAAHRTAVENYRAAEYGQDISQFELEVAQSALLFAKGESDENNQARMVITSPIDGVVLRVLQESVAVVNPGTPLIEIGDPLDQEVVIDVLSTDAVGIRPGQRVVIEHWGGESPLEARVRLVEPSAFTKVSALGIEEQRVNVIADFVSPEADRATLGDGFRVEASIIVWEETDILHIPTSAIFRTGERWTLFQIIDGRAILTDITIGMQNSRSTQVLSGLQENAQVVVHPSDQIQNGARVRVRSPEK